MQRNLLLCFLQDSCKNLGFCKWWQQGRGVICKLPVNV